MRVVITFHNTTCCFCLVALCFGVDSGLLTLGFTGIGEARSTSVLLVSVLGVAGPRTARGHVADVVGMGLGATTTGL